MICNIKNAIFRKNNVIREKLYATEKTVSRIIYRCTISLTMFGYNVSLYFRLDNIRKTLYNKFPFNPKHPSELNVLFLKKGGDKMADEKNLFPDEIRHLSEIEKILDEEVSVLTGNIEHVSNSYQETLKERQDNYYDMDTRERLNMDRAMKGIDENLAELYKAETRLNKLQDSPYFARIDFAEDKKAPAQPLYIGRFGFQKNHDILIYDWRAPVSSMFYDWDTGDASYMAPMGLIKGEMTLKRQFRIKNREILYCLDNSQTVSDDVLQEELSRTSDDRMKTIIATIQKEQNVVIRNEKAKAMIIQGVAGSGKTSIALHRIAFLLYRFRDTLKAQDILILSPSRVFSDYISDVIPELGEEPVRESGFYEIAMDEMDDLMDFEDPEDPMDMIDPEKTERAAYKSETAFLHLLEDYVRILPDRIFEEKDYTYDGTVLSGNWIKEQFLFYKNDPIIQRLPVIAEEIVEELRIQRGLHRDLPKAGTVLQKLKGFLKIKNPAALYRDFYRYIDREDLLYFHKNRLEWADVFPFLFLYHAYKGLNRYRYIKHLIVDEMQDYTPVQYAVLNILYPCQKTILGDFGQRMNPLNQSTLSDLLSLYPEAEYVELNKSYRSTYEIMDFANRISPQPHMQLLDRHGKVPEVFCFSSSDEEIEMLKRQIRNFSSSGYTTLGVILKSEKEARAFFEMVSSEFSEVHLLTSESKSFETGIVITSIQMAKGLEFDRVILPCCSEYHYYREHDQYLLYIACTRAMHELLLTGTGSLSKFIPYET